MSIIAPGTSFEVLFGIVGIIAGVYYLWRAMKGYPQPLRMLPGVVAIGDAVDRALEEGKPVFTGPAEVAYLSGQYAAMTMAGIDITRYTIRQCIRKGVRPVILVPGTAETMPLLDGIFREVCVSEGKPEMYKPEDVYFFSTHTGQRALGEFGLAERIGCAASVQVGAWGGASAACLAVERALGATLIGGTPRYNHQGTLAVICHYTFYMDEVYAAGAICSEDDVVKSSLVGSDLLKFFIVGVFLLLLSLALAGQPATKWLYT